MGFVSTTKINIMNNICLICNKRVQRHDQISTCNLCSNPIHLRCLPTYGDEDRLYANDVNGHWSCVICLQNIFPFFAIEHNEEILIEINDFSKHIHDIDSLNELIFCPFEINETDETDDLDPDNNFYSPFLKQSIMNCKYFNIEQLNKEIDRKPSNHLSIFTMNIRSLQKNHRGLISLLDIINTQFHVVALTETWLKSHNLDLYNLPGYCHIPQIRENKDGGGVSLFIREEIEYKRRPDIDVNTIDHQFLWVEIEKKCIDSKKNLIMGTIYRRPGSDVQVFNDLLANILNTIKLEGKDCIHSGD
jgi:hypothetical protein